MVKKYTMPEGVRGAVIRGEHRHELAGRLRARGVTVAELGFETLQQDEALKEQALLSLFPVKPKQTGFTSFNELNQSARINGTTTVAVLVPEDEVTGYGRSLEDQSDLDDALDELLQLGSQIQTEDEMINELVEITTQSPDFVYVAK